MQQWWGGLFQRPLLLGEVCLLGLQLHTRREVSQEAFRRTCTHSSLRVRVGTSPYSSVAGELSLGRRSYAEKVYRKQLKATTENSAAEEKSKRRRVKARKTSRPKSDNLSINSPKDSKVVGIELDFPFEGTLNKPQASREQLTSNRLQHSNGDTLTTHIGMVTAAGSDARTYDIHRNGRVFQLPSVTTVLSHTLPKQRGFMLSHWRKGLVREFGEEGYQQVRNKIIHLGSKFHAELEAQLQRPHVLSIKPRVRVGLPTSTPTHHTHLTPLPLPLSFPPNHRNSRSPLISNNTQTPANNEPNCVPGELEGEEQDIVGVGEENGEEDNKDFSSETTPQSDNKVRSTGYLQSVQHVLTDISQVYALESVVAHTELGYSGTCDCVASYRDSVCLVDWKTSSKPRPLTSDLYDYPLQAVAYAGAVNQDPHYPFKVENVLIVTAYPSGDPCHTHFLPRSQCEEYWEEWLARLLNFQTLFSSDLADVCS